MALALPPTPEYQPSDVIIQSMMAETFEYVDVISERTHTLCLREDHKMAMVSDNGTYTSPWHGNWFDMGGGQIAVIFRWCAGDFLVNTTMRRLPGCSLRTIIRDGKIRAVCVPQGVAQWDCCNDCWFVPLAPSTPPNVMQEMLH